MLKYAHPEFLWVFLLIPLLASLFLLYYFRRRRAMKKYGEYNLVRQLVPDISFFRPVTKFILLTIAFAFFVYGIADPLIGSKLEDVKREGVEIIIALDVSNSMLAEDIQPNRLENAKRAIERMVDKLRDDKIGLIVFAGKAYTQLPITTDYVSAKMFLSGISPGMVPAQGTAIGSAIDLAMKSYSPVNDKNKALIIITDGENHEDDAVAEATRAAEKGVIVHTIGMGLPQGAPIPVAGRFGKSDFKTDGDGNVVISKLNEQMLQQISSAGNGMYIRANNSVSALNTLFEEINKMAKQKIEAKIYSDYEHRFQFFIAAGIFFLLLDFIVLERRNRVFRKINLFKNFR